MENESDSWVNEIEAALEERDFSFDKRFPQELQTHHRYRSTRLTHASIERKSTPAPEVATLERKLKEIKEERAELYRVQGINAQRLLNLNESLKAKEDELAKLQSKLQSLELRDENLEDERRCFRSVIEEKEIALAYIQEELTRLQLEMFQPGENK